MVVVSNRKDDYLFIRWAQEIKRRDRYMCVVCGKRGQELHAHHLNGWNWAVEERYDIQNGTCLCTFCHNDFHDRYGKGDNTIEQFEEYKQITETFLSIVKKEKLIESGAKLLIDKMQQEEAVDFLLAELEKG